MASPVLVLPVVEGVVLVVSLEPLELLLELLAEGFFVAVGLLAAALVVGVGEAVGVGVEAGSLVSEVVVPSVFAKGVAVAVGRPSL
jgi:hypothetical protein